MSRRGSRRRPGALSVLGLGILAGGVVGACSAGSNSAAPGGGGGQGPGVGGYMAVGGVNNNGTAGFISLGGGINVGNGGAAGGVGTLPDGGVTVSAEQPENIDECSGANAAGLDGATVASLLQGSGTGGGTLRMLNPYDGTVFPRGLIAPLLMWDGTTADSLYVHLKSSMFEYKGCFKPTAPGQLQLPQAIWEKAGTHAHGPSDPFTLELTVGNAGVAMGPTMRKIVIAQATLKGTIYYNSYASKLAGPGFGGGSSGAVLRITPGKIAEAFLGQTDCIGCHSVSANGSRLVANPVLDFTGGATFALTPGMPANPPRLAPTAQGTAFPAVSPDGSVYLSSAHAGDMGTRSGVSSIFGAKDATLYETDTGVVIPNTGIPAGAMTPMFSPDGTLLVFNDFAIDNGYGLASMTYDKAARTATNYKKLVQFGTTPPPSNVAGKIPAWPFFLPDNGAVFFTMGTEKDFSGGNLGINGIVATVGSDVYFADAGTGSMKILANAMGYATDADATAGTTYLPFGAEELHHNFYPTGSPVAAGGYFWVFFDSYRHYGNTHANGQVRQLWGTAVDISADHTYSVDPSHPPFYLTGQEDVEGNHRAFTALDPCRKDGDSCNTGIDCCVGFCTNHLCGKPPPVMMGPTCSKTDESCKTAADCCDAGNHCINGFCGQIAR